MPAGGKFTEMLDTNVNLSYSERNVSLEDILKETRERSDSQSSSSGGSSGHSSPTRTSDRELGSSSASPTSPVLTKLRRFTAGKKG